MAAEDAHGHRVLRGTGPGRERRGACPSAQGAAAEHVWVGRAVCAGAQVANCPCLCSAALCPCPPCTHLQHLAACARSAPSSPPPPSQALDYGVPERNILGIRFGYKGFYSKTHKPVVLTRQVRAGSACWTARLRCQQRAPWHPLAPLRPAALAPRRWPTPPLCLYASGRRGHPPGGGHRAGHLRGRRVRRAGGGQVPRWAARLAAYLFFLSFCLS